MAFYYVNDHAQTNGDHEVHVNGCSFLHLVLHKTYLGDFSSCAPAVATAKKKYPRADGCYFCCKPCHSR